MATARDDRDRRQGAFPFGGRARHRCPRCDVHPIESMCREVERLVPLLTRPDPRDLVVHEFSDGGMVYRVWFRPPDPDSGTEPLAIAWVERLPRVDGVIEDVGIRVGLTGREKEVARLLADRWSNKEIARRLGVTVYTVARHVEGVLRKLGVHSRREVVEALERAGSSERRRRRRVGLSRNAATGRAKAGAGPQVRPSAVAGFSR